ncbi:hypothetical protein GOODEAATRI_017319, partial [Goodea atripinnis]
AIARKLHEKEMKEERRRHKGKYEEDYFEDHGGHVVHKGSGSPIAETEYGLTEVTKGLTNLDLREQELKDLEVARRLQEEELKQASNMQERAAQMAKDEASFDKVLFAIILQCWISSVQTVKSG